MNTRTGRISLCAVVLGSVLLCSLTGWAQNASTAALMSGTYAFSVGGYNPQNKPIGIGGTFVADGSGHITSGTIDVNDSSATPTLNLAITGGYTVVSDFRGTLSLTTTAQKNLTFIVSLGGIANGVAGKGEMDESDGANFTSGFLEKQDTSAFSTAAMNGGYAFGMHSKSIASSGEVYTGAAGSFTASSGNMTAGLVDSTANKTLTSGALTGTYTVGANGRGTAVFTGIGTLPVNTVFYVVSAKRWLILGTDTGIVWTGFALQQSGGPFSVASCNGPVVFSQISSYAKSPTGGGGMSIGLLTCDGNGNATFLFDESSGGTDLSLGQVGTSTGTITFAIASGTNGRFTLGGTGGSSTAYMISPNNFFLVSDGGNADVALCEAQTGGPFTNLSLNGAFSFGTQPFGQVSYLNAPNASPSSGVYVFDGSSTITQTEDRINLRLPFSATLTGHALSGNSGSASYSVAANGRVTIDSGDAIAYIVSPSKVILADMSLDDQNPTTSVLTATGATAQVTPESGWWWDPKLSGIGFFLEYGGQSVGGAFMAGFLYDAQGNATWLVSTGQVVGSTYTSSWLKVNGGQTLTGPYKTPDSSASAGNLTVAFTSPSTGVMTRPDGSQINVSRFSFTSVPIPSPANDTSEIGWWWAGSALSGTGYGMEFQDKSVFIVAYVYDTNGNPVWYLATGDLTIGLNATSTYTGTWDVYAGGPQLNSPEGSPGAHPVAGASVPMTLQFQDKWHGTLTMGSTVIPITRFSSF